MPRATRRPSRPSVVGGTEPGSPLVWAETVVHAVLAAGVVLAFSTDLEIPFILPKLLVLRAATAVLAIVWIARFNRGETRPLPRSVFAATVSLAAWWLITTATAVHPATALDGAHGRFNGFWTNAILLTLFVVTATSRVPLRQQIVRTTALVAALVVAAAYTLVQSAGLDVFAWSFSRPVSTVGQPVILATALGLGAPFALVFALTGPRGVGRRIWGAAFTMLTVAAGLTLSRGPLIAIGVASVIAILLVAKPHTVPRRTIGITAALALMTLFIAAGYVVKHRSGRFLPSVAQLTREPEIQNRLHTLRAAATMLRDRPFLGVGLENYHVLYPRYRPVEAERLTPDSVPTMVHSGYFQLAVTTGLIGLALHLCFLAVVMTSLVRGWRREAEGPTRVLIAAGIASASGYLVADLTGWPEISIMALFCIVLGMGISTTGTDAVPPSTSRGLRRMVPVAAGGWAAVLMFLTFDTIRMVSADHAVRAGRAAAIRGDWPRAQASIERILELEGSRPAYQDAAASLLAERFGTTGDRNLYDRAARLFEDAHARAPFNEYILIHRIDLETALLQKHKGSRPAPAADDAAAALLAIELHNATVYEALARLRLAAGNPSAALEMISRASALRPQQPDYRRVEGDARRAAGDRFGAMAAYREALVSMRAGTPAWLGVQRRLIVTLMETGDGAAAIDEANRALGLVPDDPLTRRLLEAATAARRPPTAGS